MSERALRILHVRSSRGYYGAEAVIETLARAQARAGHCVTVACLEDRREPHTELLDRLRTAPVYTARIQSAGRIDPAVPLRIARAARRAEADLLHVHDYKTILLGLPAAAVLRRPWVTTFHGEVADDRAVSSYERAARLALHAASGVAVVSRPQETQLRGAGIPCVFVPNAVDVAAIAAEVETARDTHQTLRADLGIGADAVVVGTVGRLCADKGQVDAFAAVEAALRFAPDAHWVIAGDGEDRQRLESRIQESPAGDRIHLAGYVAGRAALYGAFDILLHPSHREGLSMVILEAMAAGLAVAATPVGEVGALVADGRGIVLADRGPAVEAALKSLLADRNARALLGAAAHNYVDRKHSAAAMSHNYVHQLYLPALGRISP